MNSSVPDEVSRARAVSHLESHKFYTSIDKLPITRGIPVGIIRIRAKQFIDGFAQGASNSDSYFMKLRRKHPEFEDWFNAPPSNRIFLTGSGKSEAKIKVFSVDARKEGLVTFFYKDCRPPCTDEEVGAMFASSGQSGLWYDWNAIESIFLEAEIDTIRKLKGLERGHKHYIGLLSTEDIQRVEGSLGVISKAYSAARIADDPRIESKRVDDSPGAERSTQGSFDRGKP
ncbi:MAG: hypothetical protein ACK5N0_08415 [Synechococcaceae cyanobacterium]